MTFTTLTYYINSTVLVIFLIIDAILLCLVNKYRNLISNEYYDFHKKHGVLKIEICKLVVAFILIYDLHHGTIKSGAILSLTVLLIVCVIILLKDFIKQRKKEANSAEGPEEKK
jgi:hypothetical protein